MEFRIEQNENDYFDGCDNMETVDASATISAIQGAVEKRILAVYPDAEVEFKNNTGLISSRIYVDGDDDHEDDGWIRTVLDEEFANGEKNWITVS